MDNDVLIGHGDVLRDFMAAWNGRDAHPVHPVWMLSGPRGIGKATLAYKIAKMVYGNVGDFFIIDMAHNIDKDGKPKPDAKNISVYTVRAMIEKMQMSSMSGEWRVILIDSVDELTTSAENAMLKLLEEPPAKTLFLLIVHQLANVLGDLRERCNKCLPGTEITDETLRLTNGSFGRIANIKRTGGDAMYDGLIECLNNPHSHSTDVMAVSKKIADDPALYGILLDAVAAFGLADLSPSATHAIADITRVNLEPELAIFKIIMQIKKCS